MDIEAGQSDIIMKTNNETAGDIESKDPTEDVPVALATKERSESIHLPGEESAISTSTQNTHPHWQLPEVVRTLLSAFRVPGWQETLSDDESADPRDSLSGYQVLQDDDDVRHVNDGHYVIPEAELVDVTRIELESRLAELHKVHMEWVRSNRKRSAFLFVLNALMLYFFWTMPDE